MILGSPQAILPRIGIPRMSGDDPYNEYEKHKEL